MRIAYSIPTWSGAYLQETVASLPRGARILVVDTSIHAWGLSKAWNYALDRLLYREEYDVVVLINDDVVLAPNTGELLGHALRDAQFKDERPFSERQLMLVSGYNIAHQDIEHPTDTPVHTPKDLKGFKPRWGSGPDFSCFAVGRELLEHVGPFDENFQVWFEDNDMHHRIRMAGFEALSYAPYWHYGSGTVRTDPERASQGHDIFERSKEYFRQKWGGLPDEPWLYSEPFRATA